MSVNSERVWIVRIVAILTVIICISCLIVYLLSNNINAKIKSKCGCGDLLSGGFDCSNSATDQTVRHNQTVESTKENDFWVNVFATKTSDEYWVLLSPDTNIISFEKKNCINCPYSKFYLNESQVHEAHQFLKSCLIVDKCKLFGWPTVERKNQNCTIEFCLSANHSLISGQYEHFLLGIDTVNLLFISDSYFDPNKIR